MRIVSEHVEQFAMHVAGHPHVVRVVFFLLEAGGSTVFTCRAFVRRGDEQARVHLCELHRFGDLCPHAANVEVRVLLAQPGEVFLWVGNRKRACAGRHEVLGQQYPQ